MKTTALLSMGLVIFCLGCSAIAEEGQNVDARLFRGRLYLLVADNFEKQTSQIQYELLSDEDGRTFSLYFSDKIDIPNVKSGTHVEIIGHRRNGRIDVESLRILAPPKANQ